MTEEQEIEQLLLENERLREEMQETINKVIANNSKIYNKFVKMMEGQKPCTK